MPPLVISPKVSCTSSIQSYVDCSHKMLFFYWECQSHRIQQHPSLIKYEIPVYKIQVLYDEAQAPPTQINLCHTCVLKSLCQYHCPTKVQCSLFPLSNQSGFGCLFTQQWKVLSKTVNWRNQRCSGPARSRWCPDQFQSFPPFLDCLWSSVVLHYTTLE